MAERIGNIRVYRTGKNFFEYKTADVLGATGASSIRSLATMVRKDVDFAHHNGFSAMSIDFTPFHHIECPKGLEPRRCLPLTEEEQVEFWGYFVKE